MPPIYIGWRGGDAAKGAPQVGGILLGVLPNSPPSLLTGGERKERGEGRKGEAESSPSLSPFHLSFSYFGLLVSMHVQHTSLKYKRCLLNSVYAKSSKYVRALQRVKQNLCAPYQLIWVLLILFPSLHLMSGIQITLSSGTGHMLGGCCGRTCTSRYLLAGSFV